VRQSRSAAGAARQATSIGIVIPTASIAGLTLRKVRLVTTQIHHRTCHLCEAICGVSIELEDGRITTIRGDKDDPFSRGHICPKAMGLKDIHEDPDRLKAPQRRSGNTWKTISWKDALDETAARLLEVQAKHGRHSVAVYQGNPTVHNYGSMLFGQLFVRSLRTRNRYSATSVDQLPHMLAALQMFGHQLLVPIPDVDRTDHFLILGANPLASNGSLMTAPGIHKRLKAIQARGGKVIVLDPRRTETAVMADEHLFIAPQTDAFLLAAMLHTLLAEKLIKPERFASFTDGLEKLHALVQAFSPTRVASMVGIASDRIVQLARDFASAKSACLYGRVGVSTQEFGGLACWLIDVINVVTGNLDRPGGAMFTRPAFDTVGLTKRLGQRGHFDKYRSRVRKLPEFGGELPAAALAEEIDTPGEGQIKALVTSCGNPVLSTPNGRRLESALPGLEFMVSIDLYRNETTRHADLILPPTFALEHDHYDLAFHVLAVRNTARYSLPLFEKAPGALHDWEIFNGLARRLDAAKGTRAALKAYATEAALKALGPEGMLDLGLRAGPHGIGRGGLSVKALKKSVHGVDLGPLEPALPNRLMTKNQRIKLVPDIFVADLKRLEKRLAQTAQEAGTLQLIGRRDLRSNNSWMHNSLRLVKGPKRCTLKMNPRDAKERSLAPGADVRISSRVGEVVAALEISEEMMPGVVSLPHGWGHDREGTLQQIAGAHAGVSLNDLTDETLLDELSGNAVLSGTRVRVGAV
jgi:anaerobic selenocysteine-containing dehydrogenase